MLAEHYLALKAAHVAAVGVSLTLFVARGMRMLSGELPPRDRLWRALPHAIDSVLLATAVLLAMAIGQYPFVNAWLTAKVLALCAYVAFGSLALRAGRTRAVRRAAFIAAILCATYIVLTAWHHDPNPLDW